MPDSTATTPVGAADGRTRHYGEFYGVGPAPDPDDRRPVAVVVGNCKAEALRVLLDGPVRGVRIPPVHELEPHDVPLLEALLARTDVLVVQPVADDYRGLPVGTGQCIARLRPSAQVVRIPSLYYSGLYPWQVTVRHPEGPGDPPLVPYHDLRTLAEAADGRPRRLRCPARAYRQVAAESVAELQRRERAGRTLVVSDVLAEPHVEDFHTMNHPGNRPLTVLAERVRAELGITEPPADPGRILLRSVFSPAYPEIVEAIGAAGEPRSGWTVDGQAVGEDEVRQAHLEWYSTRPRLVGAGLTRHAGRLAALGLT